MFFISAIIKMQNQLELFLQSVRSIFRRDGTMSAPSSPNPNFVDNNSTFNPRTNSIDDLPRKQRMTEIEIRRFYRRRRHLACTGQDSSSSSKSTGSDDSSIYGGSNWLRKENDTTASCMRRHGSSNESDVSGENIEQEAYEDCGLRLV